MILKRILILLTIYCLKNVKSNLQNNYQPFNDFNPHLEMEGMIQTRIVAEKDLSTTQSCSHNCYLDSIKDTLNTNEYDGFLDCEYSDDTYWITKLENQTRGYKYFIGVSDGDLEHTRVFGHRDYGSGGSLSRVSSTISWSRLRKCDYCICSCILKPSNHTVTALSFRDQVSDIENNKAVVGLKFVKKDVMIHIQILEGQIFPYGKIENETWKSLEEFDYNENTNKYYFVNSNDTKVLLHEEVVNSDISKVLFQDEVVNSDDLKSVLEEVIENSKDLKVQLEEVINKNDTRVPLKEGVDYGRPVIMNLNNVTVPEDHIVTGVRFRFAGDSFDSPKLKNGPIELQIRVTPFDFVKGQLININQSTWISPEEKILEDELVFENPGNPLYEPEDDKPIITANKFVKFRASDVKKDAGQTTIPFFDGRPVSFENYFPLGGIGLIHRGHNGSGGHLAIEIF